MGRWEEVIVWLWPECRKGWYQIPPPKKEKKTEKARKSSIILLFRNRGREETEEQRRELKAGFSRNQEFKKGGG